MKARCLISGASGFLGKALTWELSLAQFEVVAIPRSFLSDPAGLKDLLKGTDYIFHLASYGNLYSQIDEQEIFNANVVKTWNLLQAAKGLPYKKIIYVSSSSVLLKIPTVYSTTKAAAEQLCKGYERVVIIRPYSITGVGEQQEHLIPTLIRAAYSGEKIPFVATPVHDFIDVDDVVKRMIELATSEITGPGPHAIGSGISYGNWQVLNIVEKVTGKTINIERVQSLRNYDTSRWISPDRWSNKSLEQSIREMVQEYVKK